MSLFQTAFVHRVVLDIFRRRKALLEGEGCRCRAHASQQGEALAGFLYRGDMSGADSPEYQERTFGLGEPLAPLGHQWRMAGAVHEVEEPFGILPHRHVDDHILAEGP